LAKSTGKLFNTHPSTKLYFLYCTGGKIPGIAILHKIISCNCHFSNKINLAPFASTAQTYSFFCKEEKLSGKCSFIITLIFSLDKIHQVFLKIFLV
jgi:hypothetical protein